MNSFFASENDMRLTSAAFKIFVLLMENPFLSHSKIYWKI